MKTHTLWITPRHIPQSSSSYINWNKCQHELLFWHVMDRTIFRENDGSWYILTSSQIEILPLDLHAKRHTRTFTCNHIHYQCLTLNFDPRPWPMIQAYSGSRPIKINYYPSRVEHIPWQKTLTCKHDLWWQKSEFYLSWDTNPKKS